MAKNNVAFEVPGVPALRGVTASINAVKSMVDPGGVMASINVVKSMTGSTGVMARIDATQGVAGFTSDRASKLGQVSPFNFDSSRFNNNEKRSQRSKESRPGVDIAGFLQTYAKMGVQGNDRGLNPTEGMVLLQLMMLVEGESMLVQVSLRRLAERVSRTERQVRTCLSRLERLGILRRIRSNSGENTFDLAGLFKEIARFKREESESLLLLFAQSGQ